MNIFSTPSNSIPQKKLYILDKDESIHIASILCGNVDKIREIAPLLTSAILLSESRLVFHFITDANLELELRRIVKLDSVIDCK